LLEFEAQPYLLGAPPREMAPSASEATSSSATSATSSSDADAPASPSPSPSRRAVPTLLLVSFLAALLVLSSGDDATAQPLNGIVNLRLVLRLRSCVCARAAIVSV
jgi:hypothetical protein